LILIEGRLRFYAWRFIACFLRAVEHPAVSFLHQVFGVDQKLISRSKHLIEKNPVAHSNNEADRRAPTQPLVLGFPPGFGPADQIRELVDQMAESAATEVVAGAPTIDIFFQPAFKPFEILLAVVFFYFVSPVKGEKPHVPNAGGQQVVTDRQSSVGPDVFRFSEALIGYFAEYRGFQTNRVLKLLFEKALVIRSVLRAVVSGDLLLEQP
jgi:hypothetical protein